jgi:hypothetical protein
MSNKRHPKRKARPIQPKAREQVVSLSPANKATQGSVSITQLARQHANATSQANSKPSPKPGKLRASARFVWARGQKVAKLFKLRANAAVLA